MTFLFLNFVPSLYIITALSLHDMALVHMSQRWDMYKFIFSKYLMKVLAQFWPNLVHNTLRTRIFRVVKIGGRGPLRSAKSAKSGNFVSNSSQI